MQFHDDVYLTYIRYSIHPLCARQCVTVDCYRKHSTCHISAVKIENTYSSVNVEKKRISFSFLKKNCVIERETFTCSMLYQFSVFFLINATSSSSWALMPLAFFHRELSAERLIENGATVFIQRINCDCYICTSKIGFLHVISHAQLKTRPLGQYLGLYRHLNKGLIQSDKLPGPTLNFDPSGQS